MLASRDVLIKDEHPTELLLDKHIQYLKQYANEEQGTDQIMSEFLKMSGMYWGLNALCLMKAIDETSSEVERALEFVKNCQSQTEGGFGAALNHDPHILQTLSAVQILVLLNKCHRDYIDIDKCVAYIKSLQQSDGSFFGDKWGEVDTRFSFCALATLRLLNKLQEINLDKAIEFIWQCYNDIDGGFGSKPGSESHAAYVYCCVGSLAIANGLDKFKLDKLQTHEWLSERQLPSGGLNGRPEKLPDLCYSWWCLSSLCMIENMNLVDKSKLRTFILACQDPENGGFSDRPGNCVDPYHTMFAIASLSLICHSKDKTSLQAYYEHHQQKNESHGAFLDWRDEMRLKLRIVDPILCMPCDVLVKLREDR